MSPKRRHTSLKDYKPTIYQTADGKWHGRIIVGYKPDGSYIRPHRVRDTPREIRQVMAELQARRDQGFIWNSDKVTVGAWLTHWLEVLIRPHRSHKTYADYRSKLKCHILPVLGGMTLTDLEREDIERLYASMYARGLSDYTVHGAHRVLRSGLGQAVERKRLVVNPAAHAEVREPEEPDIDPFLVDEIAAAIRVARSMNNFPRWSLALALGLRQGEALGLRWSDLNLGTGTLAVRKQLQRITWEHGCTDPSDAPRCGKTYGAYCPDRHGGGLLLVKVKTHRSKRPISLPKFIIDLLEVHRREQLEQRMRASHWGDMNLIFCGPEGQPLDPKHDRAQWHALLARADLRDARLHDARHSAASMLLALEVDQRFVMDVMGWTELRTANRYMHVVAEQRRAVADRLDHALGFEHA
ncbi:site-specific integrase [Nocardioides KLBMP 9356]|uniref:Site-specific integrase n=1 Tax=Nocardioides potassii TaxID=2911371 RepID=A0ABS9HCN3_9ACTN|nr:site-specific integrase [Nocardioides potassii]MCF6378103.1 site-specific integrase [Nocardioides potassii]